MPLRKEAAIGPSRRPTLWCAIYQVVGKHVTDNCHLLQNFLQTSQSLFYNFYKSVGHDENNCHSYELMMERTPTYQIKEETKPLDQGAMGACEGYQGNGLEQGGGGPGRG